MQSPQELLRDVPRLEHLCKLPIPSDTLALWSQRGLFFCTDVDVSQSMVRPSGNEIGKTMARFVVAACDPIVDRGPVAPAVDMALIANPDGYYRDTLGQGRGVVSVLRSSSDAQSVLWMGEPNDTNSTSTGITAGLLSLSTERSRLLGQSLRQHTYRRNLHLGYDHATRALTSVKVGGLAASDAGSLFLSYESLVFGRGLTNETLKNLGGTGLYFMFRDLDTAPSNQGVTFRMGAVEGHDSSGVRTRSLPAELVGKPELLYTGSPKFPVVRHIGEVSIRTGDDFRPLRVPNVRASYRAARSDGGIVTVDEGVLRVYKESDKRTRRHIMRNGRLDLIQMSPDTEPYRMPRITVLEPEQITQTHNRAYGAFVRVRS